MKRTPCVLLADGLLTAPAARVPGVPAGSAEGPEAEDKRTQRAAPDRLRP
jgi:hypothetical protein